jgi:hypothetical protein
MKHTIEKRTTVRKDKNSDWEIRQIQLLNADRNRSYPEFDHNPQSYRVNIVMGAMPRIGNTFAFIRQTTRLARMIHNRNNSRFAHAVNRAMQMITADTAAPGQRQHTAAVPQAVAA